jgi:hypothetical protein
MKNIIITFVGVGILLLGGCAQQTSSNATSFIDPAWDGGRASSILIEVQQASLREREAIERASVEALAKQGIAATASIDIFLPTRTYSAAERKKLARNSGSNHVLIITQTDKNIEHSYTPPMRARPYGGFGWGSGGYHYGGVGIGIDTGLHRAEPIATYRAILAPLSTDKTIWVGDFVTQGPTGMSFTRVGERFANYLVRQLQADGMI